MAELTRGQKGARTRAANKAKREAEEATKVAATPKPRKPKKQVQVVSNADIFGIEGYTAGHVTGFIQSLSAVEAEAYGALQAGTTVVTRFEGKEITAKFDGADWQLKF